MQTTSVFQKRASACLLGGVFLLSLFPLSYYFPELQRSHEWALPVTPADWCSIVLVCCVACGLFLLIGRRMPDGPAEIILKCLNRLCAIPASVFLGVCFVAHFSLTNVLSYAALGHIPHVQDSIAQLFQARIFTSGQLTAPLPPFSEFFEYMNMIMRDGRWYSQYPPGHALVLVPGLWLEAPWLTNPLLGAGSVLLVYGIAMNCYQDSRVARFAVILFVLSPFVFFMSSGFMNHVSTMFFLLLFLWFYTKAIAGGNPGVSFLCGCALGFALLIRPLTAAAVGLPFVLDYIRTAFSRQGIGTSGLVCFFAGLLLFCGLLLGYNYLTNGDALLFGYQARHSGLGFLGASQFGPPHTLTGGWVNASNTITALNKYLFEWPIPSLLFVFVLFLPGVARNRWDNLFLASTLALAGAYFFYFYQDLCFGPRFMFSAAPLLVLLTVRGCMAVPGLGMMPARKAGAALCIVLAGCFLYMGVYAFPRLYKKYSTDYWYVSDRVAQAVNEQGIENAVVFVDVSIPRSTDVPNILAYGDGFVHNGPGLETDVVYVMDLGRKNRDLMGVYPGRKYYVLTYKPLPAGFEKTKPALIPLRPDTIEQISTGTNLTISRNYAGGGTRDE